MCACQGFTLAVPCTLCPSSIRIDLRCRPCSIRFLINILLLSLVDLLRVMQVDRLFSLELCCSCLACVSELRPKMQACLAVQNAPSLGSLS